MKRKLIKQGKNTITITLPSTWVSKYNLLPGNEVDLLEQEHSLVIKPNSGSADVSSTTVNISDLPNPVIWRYIVSAYRAGYSEIRIEGISPGKKDIYSAFSYNTIDYLKSHGNKLEMSPMEVVSSAINRLIGMEIIEHKENYCIAKELSETSYKEFDHALRRIFLLLKIEAENIMNGIEGKIEGLKSQHIIDTNLDRVEDFCLRVLNKKGFRDFKKTPTMYALIFTLEMIGDEFKKLSDHMIDAKGRYRSEIIYEISRACMNQIERVQKLHYSFEKKKTREILEVDDSLTELVKKNLNKFNIDDAEILHHFKKVGVFIRSCVELIIDLQF